MTIILSQKKRIVKSAGRNRYTIFDVKRIKYTTIDNNKWFIKTV